MAQAAGEQIFPIFFAVWVALAVVSTAFFFLSRNASLKRKIWPPFAVGIGVLFLGFVWLMGSPSDLYITAPVVALITVLNVLRGLQFCDSCGKTLLNRNPFSKPAFCSKCGAKLQ
jgi:hypothetical protein